MFLDDEQVCLFGCAWVGGWLLNAPPHLHAHTPPTLKQMAKGFALICVAFPLSDAVILTVSVGAGASSLACNTPCPPPTPLSLHPAPQHQEEALY